MPDPDFGDGPVDAAKARLVDVLEDVGGPWGYREFLDAIADPSHEGQDERLHWIGSNFDPADTHPEALAQAAHTPAKRWPASQPLASALDQRSPPDGYSEGPAHRCQSAAKGAFLAVSGAQRRPEL